MGRHRSFDENAALDTVAELFWSQGYEGTSLADIEARLGVGRQSLYNAFGDKRALFLRALERYSSWNAERLVNPLLSPGAGLGAIRGYFDFLVEFLTPEGERRGCLVANSLLEMGVGDVGVAERCKANQTLVLRGLTQALSNAVANDELPNTTEVDVTARMLLAQTYGFSVLSKSGMSRRQLSELAAEVVERLGAGSTKP